MEPSQKGKSIPQVGERRQQKKFLPVKTVVKAIKNQSPMEAIPLLDYDNIGSWIRWKDAICSYAEAIYPSIGDCLQGTRGYRTLAEPNDADRPSTYRDLTADIRKEIDKMLWSNFFKKKEKVDEEKRLLYGVIKRTISSESHRLVQESAEYEEDDKDPVILFNILESIHAHGPGNLSNLQKPSAALENYVNCKQKPDETITDFKERYTGVYRHYNKIVGNERAIPEDQITMDFMVKLDRTRYSKFQAKIKEYDDTGETDAVPKTIDKAINLAQRMCSGRSLGGLHQLGFGQKQKNYPTVFAAQISPQEKLQKVVCYQCKKAGHYKSQCPERKEYKKSEETVQVKKSVEEVNAGIVIEEISSEEGISFSPTIMYSETNDDACTMLNFFTDQATETESVTIYLDSGANRSVIGEEFLLDNIRNSKNPFRVRTAHGIVDCHQVGDFFDFGEAIYLKGSPNLLALRDAENRYSVKYVQSKHFILTLKGNPSERIFFERDNNHMYSIKIKKSEIIEAGVFMDYNIKRSNEGMYTNQEVIRARRAREIVRILGFPADGGLSYDIKNGGMLNNPVTTRDLVIASELFGKDVASMKGKATVPPAMIESYMEVEKSSTIDQSMYSDIMEIENNKFIISVLKPMGLVLINHIQQRTARVAEETLLNQIQTVQNKGFRIIKVTLDPASEFVSVSRFDLDGVPVTLVGPNAHVHMVERQIRTIKERVRAVIYSLEWKLPYSLIKFVVYFCVIRLNQIARRSLGPVSPTERFTGKKLNFSKDVRVGFGDYVQIKTNSRSNTMESRTRGCIALIPLSSSTGTHLFFSLDKGTLIRADSWTALPTPDIVINQMNRFFERIESTKKKKNPSLEGKEKKPTEFIEDSWSIGELKEEIEDKEDKEEKEEKEGPQDSFQLHVSVAEAMRKYDGEAIESVRKELTEIWTRGVITPIAPEDIPEIKKGNRVISSFLFLKEKLALDGSLKNLKSRLVADGSQQVATTDVSSPTACLESVLMTLAIAASERRNMVAVDIGNAFLEADIGQQEVYMRINSHNTKILCQIAKEVSKYVTKNGDLVVKLNKSLYGCIQSSKQWFLKIKQTLNDQGFVCNDYDECVLNKFENGHQVTAVLYVDDILFSCVEKRILIEIINKLKKSFKEVKFSEFNLFEYLGYEIDNTGENLTISMLKNINGILAEHGHSTNIASSPCRLNFFEREKDSELLCETDSRVFHRRVAQLLFLAKRIRFDILLAVSVMAGRVSDPTQQDKRDLDRLIFYLNGSRGLKLIFEKGKPLLPEVYIDASFACHEGGKSRSATVVMMCGVCVGCWTAKQGLVTRSSTEAELVALSDGSAQAIWIRNWLLDQGYKDFVLKIMQDNQSVIQLMGKDGSPKQRTKHMDVKYFYVRNLIKDKKVRLEYISTHEMIADNLTKPLSGALFEDMRSKMSLS